MSEQARTVAERIEDKFFVAGQTARIGACGPVLALSKRLLSEARSDLTAYAAEIWEAAAKEADKWAHSHSCQQHDDNPCCHVRTGAAIAARLRAHAVSRQEQPK